MVSAIHSYEKAVEWSDRGSDLGLAAAGRLAALYEERGESRRAIAAYRNLLHAKDPELVAAAESRITELSDPR